MDTYNVEVAYGRAVIVVFEQGVELAIVDWQRRRAGRKGGAEAKSELAVSARRLRHYRDALEQLVAVQLERRKLLLLLHRSVRLQGRRDTELLAAAGRGVDGRTAQRVLQLAIREARHGGHRHGGDAAAFAGGRRQLLTGRSVRYVVDRRPERRRHAHAGHTGNVRRTDRRLRACGTPDCWQ